MMPLKPLLLLSLCATLLGCNGRATYAEQCSAPLPHWRTQERDWHNPPVIITVRISAGGELRWNGASVSREQLQEYLSIVPTLNPAPATVLKVDPAADCARVTAVREEMDQSLQCRQGGCAEGEGEWGDGSPFPDRNEMTPEQNRALTRLEEQVDRVSEEAMQPTR